MQHIVNIYLHVTWHIYLHILHILKCNCIVDLLFYIFICIFSGIFLWIFCMLCTIIDIFQHTVYIEDFSVLCIFCTRQILLVFIRLFSSLLGLSSDGPAVRVPPHTSIFAVFCFMATSSWKVCWFSLHLVRYRPSGIKESSPSMQVNSTRPPAAPRPAPLLRLFLHLHFYTWLWPLRLLWPRAVPSFTSGAETFLTYKTCADWWTGTHLT